MGYAAFNCVNIVWATGGRWAVCDTVYPEGQHGATGIALEAGARGRNLTEWQYGLASVSPRWNVSGTYMQVLPRFVSTDAGGGDEREFLDEYFDSRGALLDCVFLKGYQWPFDVRKAAGGSSLIDILVYVERCVKERRVFLDFTRNAGGGEADLTRWAMSAGLSGESGRVVRHACGPPDPYERRRMNFTSTGAWT